MAEAEIRLGTRASVLARTQSALVGEALAAVAGTPWREVLVRTHGDDTTRPLDQPGRPGLFVSALRDALLAGEVDVIVHSYKDLPSAPAPGIVLAAVPMRADARDALVSANGGGLASLPAGAVVGTSSPRRAAALLRLRPDLAIRPIRGNVDTRIAKVRTGEFDATVLAVAGLARIGREDEIAEILDDLLPAPAQGALAVECRSGDDDLRGWLAALDDPVARLITTAEREVLVGIDAACTTAIAARASVEAGNLRVEAELHADDSVTVADVQDAVALDDLVGARALGLRAAARLAGAEPGRGPVLLVRSEGNDSDAASLSELGVPAISDPYLQIVPRRAGTEATLLLDHLAEASVGPAPWLVATSPMAVPSWTAAVGESAMVAAVEAAVAAGVRAAATGERTAATLRAAGFADVVLPREGSSAAALLETLSGEPAGRVLFPCGNQALRTLPEGLAARGWSVEEAVVYDTTVVEERPGSTVLLQRAEVSAVVLRSPSAVRALTSFVQPADSVLIVCAGETTAATARECGLRVDAVATSPSSNDVAATVAALLPT